MEIKIDNAKLKAAVTEINALEFPGVDKIRTVGISYFAMAIQFIKAINFILDKESSDNVPEENSKISEKVADCYNELPDPADLQKAKEEEEASKPEKKKKEPKEPKEKKVKPPKEPKEPKEKVVIEKSRYGHVKNAKSGKLDELLFEGATIKDMMEKVEVPRVRVIGHANHLVQDLGLTLLKTENKEDGLLTVLRIKEEVWDGTKLERVPKEKKEKPPKKEKKEKKTPPKEVVPEENVPEESGSETSSEE